MFSEWDYDAARGLRLIADAEAAMLSELAGELARHPGRYVDAGAFLGGATLALASGLDAVDAPRVRKIVSVDRFTAADDYLVEKLLEIGIAIRHEQSFLPLFLSNIDAHRNRVEVRAGDVLRVGEVDEAIDLLVLDLAKTQQLNAYVLLRWFPKMVAGRSILYHQDFHSPFYLWNPVAVGLLRDHFDLIVPKVGEAAVFRLRSSFDPALLARAAAVNPVSPAGLAAIRRAKEMFPAEQRHTLDLAECLALSRSGAGEAAGQLFDAVRSSTWPKSDEKWTRWVEQVQRILERNHARARPSPPEERGATLAATG